MKMDSKTFNSLSEAYAAVYSEAVYGGKKEEPKDTRYTVTAADKKGNTPAYQKYKAGDKRYKAADHMNEVYKGKHGQSDKEYADSRSQGGKMISGDSKRSGAEYTHGRRVKAANPGMQPDVGGKTKPKSQGKMDAGTRADLQYRKANLKKEELEASGLFTEEEINAILESDEQYEFIDDLSDEELSDVVEEVIGDLLEEGYEFEDVEDILKEELIGEILSEARVDMSARAARRKADMAASEKSAKAARKAGAAVVSKEKRAARVARVKGAVKSGVSRAKSAVKSGVAKAKEAGREAKFKAVDKKVAAYANKRNLHPAAGMAARSKDPAKRRGLRAKVAKDIASRASAKAKEVKGKATQKAASAAVSGYAAGRAAKQAVGDAAGRAKQSAKNMAARAGRAVKSGVKGLIRKAAEKVASGATKVAKRMSEEYTQYDLVLEFLVDHEIAEDLQEAQWLMINELDREDIETITSLYN